MRIEFTLPWPPSVNSTHRTFAGRMLVSLDYRTFKKAVGKQVLVQRIPRHWTTERLAIGLLCQPPNRRKYDIDNRIKPTLDALMAAGVIPDDECIDQLTIARGPVVPGGAIRVVIEEWSTLPPDLDYAAGIDEPKAAA